MNVENINKAIAIMERVKSYDAKLFYMGQFRAGDVYYTEKEILDCGTSCCFSGWLSVAQEFADYPNKMRTEAFELSTEDSPEASMAKLLDISLNLATNIIYTHFSYLRVWGRYNIVRAGDVKPDHIIDILKRIKLGELE